MGGVRRQLIRASLLPLLALGLLVPRTLTAQVRFEVSALAEPGATELAVELRLHNSGAAGARDVFIEAELGALRAEAELGVVAAGEVRSSRLRFPGAAPRAGRHALILQIEYKPAQPADAAARQQPGLVLLELGDAGPPALGVRIEPPPPLDVSSIVWVVLESLDRAPHRASLKVLLPTGVSVLEAPSEVAVPATGAARAPVRLLRGDAPRGGRHALTVVAVARGEALESASAAHAGIEISADPAWLPRLRPGLFALGVVLLLGALLGEWLARRGSRA